MRRDLAGISLAVVLFRSSAPAQSLSTMPTQAPNLMAPEPLRRQPPSGALQRTRPGLKFKLECSFKDF